jgi:sugar/nucleoside kinase (ribokinase family)
LRIADITSVGGAASDLFVSAPHALGMSSEGQRMIQYPLGAKIKVESILQSCGGGAANTSIGFSRLGLRARFCGILGDDEWGQSILRTLEREGVLTDAAVIVEGEISSFSIILRDPDSGERAILYSSNVNAHLCDSTFSKDLLRSSRWLFLNHLTDISCQILDDCLELVRPSASLGPPTREDQRCCFAWNPGGSQLRRGHRDPLLRALLEQTDLLFVNAEEARMFTGQDSLKDAIQEGLAAGVRIVCVTEGSRGARLATRGEEGRVLVWVAPPPPLCVTDATGAGDAFAVGVTWAMLRKLDLPTALKAGMLNAASVISVVGTQAGLLTEQQMQQQLTEIDLPILASTL